MTTQLAGKVVAITGAARGIGYAIAHAAKTPAGTCIAISDVDESALVDAAKTLNADYFARLDVTDPEAFGEFLRAAEVTLGPLGLEYRRSGVLLSAILLGTVGTELAAGLSNPPGVRIAAPAEVAASVIDTIAGGKSRSRVYIPAPFGFIVRSSALLPRRLHEAASRLLGSDRLILRPQDSAARSRYNQRAGRS